MTYTYYNRNAFAHLTIGEKIMGKTVKLIATPIGLVSEAIHHKDKKKQEASNVGAHLPASTSPPTYVIVPPEQADELIVSGQAEAAEGQEATHEFVREDEESDGHERDEAVWVLDEATVEDPAPQYEEEQPVESLIQNIHPNPTTASRKAPHKLPFPVIPPQRRPCTKTRGFVRAYAPTLQDSGIDQEMFLSFLKSFHNASKASPVFNVILIATTAAQAYPSPLVSLGVVAINAATLAAQDVQERYRLNKFLNQANKEIFAPKGLYDMVVTYKPEVEGQPQVATTTVDLGAAAVAKYGKDIPGTEQVVNGNGKKEKMKGLRIASGTTHGEAEMPIVCQAFAEIRRELLRSSGSADLRTSNTLPKQISHSDKQQIGCRAPRLDDDFLSRADRPRVQIPLRRSRKPDQQAPLHPVDRRMMEARTVPPLPFLPSLSSPSPFHLPPLRPHPYNIPSTNKIPISRIGAKRRYQRAQQKAASERAVGIKTKPSKRMLQGDVLYLTIVSMPTPRELEEVRRRIAAEETAKKKVKVPEVGGGFSV